MDLNELIIKKENLVAELKNLVDTGKSEKRELTNDENTQFENLEAEIRKLDSEIEAKNNSENNINIKKMEKFSDKLVRNQDRIENFNVRAITLSNTIDDVTVANNMSVVGYEPFYKQMGVEIMPNLSSSIKLPFVAAIVAGKKAQGERHNGNANPQTVTLQPSRYTVTETIGKELLAVGNETALQSFLFEMAKDCDRAVTKDIYDVAVAGSTAQSGLSGYTTTNLDTLIANVDGDVKLLMPRGEFYKAKGTKVDTGSGLFLANKNSQFSGSLWDGTPLFYSSLFSGTTVVAADLKHITVGEFGDEYEIIFDNLTKAPEGQVVVTVCKLADVKLRNAQAVKKAVIA